MISRPRLVDLDAFLALFEDAVHDQIRELLVREDVQGIVCCTVLDLWSSQAGHRTGVIFGPGCTIKEADIPALRLGETPSSFHYPTEIYYKDPATRTLSENQVHDV